MTPAGTEFAPRRSSLDLQMRNGLPQIRQFWKTKTVQLRIWKHVYLTPFVRLNLYTRRFTICIGPSPGVGWYLRPGGIRSTLDTGTAGTLSLRKPIVGGDRA